MPTAVGPNTKGEENLVFGYDLGDVQNSYKGEPVENLQTVDEGNVYTSVSTVNTTAELVDMVTPFGNKAWKITIPASGTNGYSNTRAQGPAVTINRDGTYYYHGAWVWMSDDDYALWVQSSNYIYKYSTGSNGLGQWIHRSALDRRDRAGRLWRAFGTWNALTAGGTASERHTFFKNGTLTRDLVFYIVAPMWGVGKSHPIQFTAGTRSATQGLIDLTGNSTIDLSNVSFDSNAQIDYDGSSDYINLGSSLNSIGSNATFEMVFKAEETNDNYRVMLGWGNGNSNYSGIHIGSWTSGYTDESFHVSFNSGALILYVRKGHTFYKDNTYHHAIVTAGPGNYAIWIDGVEQTLTYGGGNQSTTFDNIIGYNANIVAEIGRRPYGSGTGYFNGKLPLMKIYDRILTDSEVKANYNAIKGRFNI